MKENMEKQAELKPLINKTVTGDREAFEQLIHSQMGLLFSKIRKIAKSNEDAEDIRQRVMLCVYQNIRTLRIPEAYSSWLNKIIVSEYVSYYKKDIESISLEALSEFESEMSDTNEEYLPYAHLERLERSKCVNAAIERLPQASKDMVVLFYSERMGYKKIADHLGVTVSSVSSRIYRAKRRLRKDLRCS